MLIVPPAAPPVDAVVLELLAPLPPELVVLFELEPHALTANAAMAAVTVGPYRLLMAKDSGIWRIARLIGGFDAPF